jgi:DHA1 family tetracycline resistance protein-like MFS transporter
MKAVIPNGLKIKSKYPHLTPLWFAVFNDILGLSIMFPLLPLFVKSFGSSPLEVGLVTASNALFSFFFGPLLGRLSDKYGRKPLLMISQIGTFFGFLILAFSQNIQTVLLSRIVDGVFGGAYPISKAIIGDVVEPKDRSLQMSNIGLMHNFSNLIGPAAGGILSVFGIIAPGLFCAGLTFANIFVTYFKLEETAPSKTSIHLKINSDDYGSNKPSSEIGNNNNENNNNENNNNSINNNNNNTSPKITNVSESDLQVWKNKVARMLLIQWAFHTLAFMSFQGGLTLFANIKFGMGSVELGILLSIAGAFQIFDRLVIFNPMLRKIGEIKTSKLGLSLFVCVYIIVGFIVAPYQLVILLLINSFAATSVRGILTGFISRSVHPKVLGKTMAYSTSLDSFAQIIGPIVGGAMLQSFDPSWYGLWPSIFALSAFSMMFRKFEFKYEKSPKHSE